MRIKNLEKNKKGNTHIEIVLSFVIFAGFLLFFLAVFNPFKIQKQEIIADNAEKKIKEDLSIGLSFFSIKTNINENNQQKPRCFYFPYKTEGRKAAVKDKERNSIKAFVSDGNINIENTDNFFYVYLSEEFIESNELTGCYGLAENDYMVGQFMEMKVISSKKALELKNKYNIDYGGLKRDLGISADDFIVNLKDVQGNLLKKGDVILLETSRKRGNTKVFAKTLPVQVLFENGEIMSGVISIEVW